MQTSTREQADEWVNKDLRINAVVPNDGLCASSVLVHKPYNGKKPSIRWATDFLPLNEKTELLSVEDSLYTPFPSSILF